MEPNQGGYGAYLGYGGPPGIWSPTQGYGTPMAQDMEPPPQDMESHLGYGATCRNVEPLLGGYGSHLGNIEPHQDMEPHLGGYGAPAGCGAPPAGMKPYPRHMNLHLLEIQLPLTDLGSLQQETSLSLYLIFSGPFTTNLQEVKS